MEIMSGNPFKSRVLEIDENKTVTVLQMIRVLYRPTIYVYYDRCDN